MRKCKRIQAIISLLLVFVCINSISMYAARTSQNKALPIYIVRYKQKGVPTRIEPAGKQVWVYTGDYKEKVDYPERVTRKGGVYPISEQPVYRNVRTN